MHINIIILILVLTGVLPIIILVALTGANPIFIHCAIVSGAISSLTIRLIFAELDRRAWRWQRELDDLAKIVRQFDNRL